MRTKRLAIWFGVIAVAGLVGISGCTRQVPRFSPTPTPTSAETPEQSPEPNLSPSPTPTVGAVTKDLSSAHNAFGFNILHQIAKADSGKNIFISPTSIALALTMAYQGAAGGTKQEMANTLQITGWDSKKVFSENKKLLDAYGNIDPKVKIAIANSLWARQGFTIRPAYLMDMQAFRAKVSALDFSSPQAAPTINAWVSDSTNKKIPTIVDPPINPLTMMYLINAVYFKGEWTIKFDPKLTRDREFISGTGAKTNLPMMEQRGDFQYLKDTDVSAVSLPYGKNKRLSMFVFLPKDLAKFASGLDQPAWEKLIVKFGLSEGTVVLPRFKLEYEKELNAALMALGMPTAFDESRADFSAISDKELYISKVKHKSFVEVNEEGTVAAAVTGVEVMVTAAPSEPPFYFEVNRPFFFAIRDNVSGELLFVGMIEKL